MFSRKEHPEKKLCVSESDARVLDCGEGCPEPFRGTGGGCGFDADFVDWGRGCPEPFRGTGGGDAPNPKMTPN